MEEDEDLALQLELGKKKKKKKKPKKKKGYTMDPDHRLLLKNAKPLLQSRNAAVVMGVAQLYHHVAPRNEFGIIVKPLIRLLKGHVETQAIVLSNVATISAGRCAMFEPYLKSFYIHSSDPTNIRLLKLDIIANVAGESSIHTILREFRTYISSPDKQFAAATIEAIGRVACSISEVTETCLHGLMSLLSHKSENVVAQSVVVIKKLLQLHPKQNKDLIDQVARLADSVTVPMAKASILWLVGEYCSLVPKMGPDVLRKAAKNFVNESDIVKLQTVNLAAKLVLSNPKQTRLLCDYVLSLAKYDQNYDIRDRARFLKQLVTPPEGEETALSKYAKKILLAPKPAPVLESAFKDRIHWQLGSLSHAVNSEATGYMAISDFPAEPPDPTVRNVEDDSWWGKTNEKKKNLHDESG
jgi:AP-3 complex subunit beta